MKVKTPENHHFQPVGKLYWSSLPQHTTEANKHHWWTVKVKVILHTTVLSFHPLPHSQPQVEEHTSQQPPPNPATLLTSTPTTGQSPSFFKGETTQPTPVVSRAKTAELISDIDSLEKETTTTDSMATGGESTYDTDNHN